MKPPQLEEWLLPLRDTGRWETVGGQVWRDEFHMDVCSLRVWGYPGPLVKDIIQKISLEERVRDRMEVEDPGTGGNPQGRTKG